MDISFRYRKHPVDGTIVGRTSFPLLDIYRSAQLTLKGFSRTAEPQIVANDLADFVAFRSNQIGEKP